MIHVGWETSLSEIHKLFNSVRNKEELPQHYYQLVQNFIKELSLKVNFICE
jgi:hypothetical protein